MSKNDSGSSNSNNSLSQTARVQSPMEGRGTGVRHRGGGAFDPGKGNGKSSSGGFAGNQQTGGLQMGQYSPQPGALSQVAQQQQMGLQQQQQPILQQAQQQPAQRSGKTGGSGKR